MLKLDPIEVQQREKKGGYRRHETRGGIASTENRLLGRRLVSEGTPHHNQLSYPGAYHPSSHLSATRSTDEQKRERGRLDASAASSGRKVAESSRRTST
jgi:hypothetical protein